MLAALTACFFALTNQTQTSPQQPIVGPEKSICSLTLCSIDGPSKPSHCFPSTYLFLPVTFYIGITPFNTTALLDTGASDNFIDIQKLKLLNGSTLLLEKKQEVQVVPFLPMISATQFPSFLMELNLVKNLQLQKIFSFR